MSEAPAITVDLALQCLARRHSKDLFVPECKVDSSSMGLCPRLDAWAMVPTWTKIHTIGYEVKLSRSDFLGDRKWMNYLPFCSEFYFVTPYRMVAAEEVPSGAGLLWLSKTASCAYTKVKAAWRDLEAEDLVQVLRYVVMWRARITRDRRDVCDLGFWRRWLEDKSERKLMGTKVAMEIQRLVYDAQDQALQTRKKMEGYDEVRARLVELGVNPDTPLPYWTVSRKVEEALKGPAAQTIEALERAQQSLKAALMAVAVAQQEARVPAPDSQKEQRHET